MNLNEAIQEEIENAFDKYTTYTDGGALFENGFDNFKTQMTNWIVRRLEEDFVIEEPNGD